MNNLQKSVFNILMVLLIVSCGNGQTEADAAQNPSSKFTLSENQIVAFKQAAGRGDMSAMLRLADYYSVSLDNEMQGIYWLEQAGNAGDLNARESVIQYYESVPQPKGKEGYVEKLKERWEM